MHETFRMLGQEHEADLAREAAKWHRGDEVRRAKSAPLARPSMKSRLNPVQVGLLLARIGRKTPLRSFRV